MRDVEETVVEGREIAADGSGFTPGEGDVNNPKDTTPALTKDGRFIDMEPTAVDVCATLLQTLFIFFDPSCLWFVLMTKPLDIGRATASTVRDENFIILILWFEYLLHDLTAKI